MEKIFEKENFCHGILPLILPKITTINILYFYRKKINLVLKTSKFNETKSTIKIGLFMCVQGKTFPFCLLREAWDDLEERLDFLFYLIF